MSLERLEPLADLERWSATSESGQDEAIAAAAALLGPSWAHLQTRTWACVCRVPAPAKSLVPPITVPLFHRLASFKHLSSGTEMALIPGRAERLAPFLIARWPMTRERWGLPPKGGWRDRLPYVIEDLAETEQRLRDWGLRLPTRAEWRHAAESGSRYEFPWGESLDLDSCWFAENASDPELAKSLGYRRDGPDFTVFSDRMDSPLSRPQLQPLCIHEKSQRWNAFGLVDTFGNIWELLAPRSREGEDRIILDAAGGSFAELGFEDPPILIKDLTWPTERALGLRLAASLEPRSEMALGLAL